MQFTLHEVVLVVDPFMAGTLQGTSRSAAASKASAIQTRDALSHPSNAEEAEFDKNMDSFTSARRVGRSGNQYDSGEHRSLPHATLYRV